MRKEVDLMFLIKEHRYKVNPRDVICFQSMLRKAIQSMLYPRRPTRIRRLRMRVGACSSTPVNIIIKARVLLIKVMILYTNAKLEGIGRGEMERMNKNGLSM